MKRKLFAVAAVVAVLTLGVLIWQRDYIAQFVSLSSKSLRGKVGVDVKSPKLDYLSPTEKEIIGEMNLARTNPQQYATFLEEAKKTLSGNQIRFSGMKTITLKEGASAIDEAIQFLRAAKPLPPLEVSKGMCLGAKDHVKDLGMSGSTGHKGSDGSLPDQRVNRYGMWQLAIGENIAYSSSNAREVVLGMIVDDGKPERGHRLNIFNAAHHVAGVAGQPSPNGIICVVTYAGGFVEKGETATAAKMF